MAGFLYQGNSCGDENQKSHGREENMKQGLSCEMNEEWLFKNKEHGPTLSCRLRDRKMLTVHTCASRFSFIQFGGPQTCHSPPYLVLLVTPQAQ